MGLTVHQSHNLAEKKSFRLGRLDNLVFSVQADNHPLVGTCPQTETALQLQLDINILGSN
jgi:hypothetical protein